VSLKQDTAQHVRSRTVALTRPGGESRILCAGAFGTGLSVIAGNLIVMGADSDIDRLLRRQHGAVTRAQLLQAGCSANTIDSWVRRGRLLRVLHGVYSTGVSSLATRAHAAYLWQPEGVVSHLAATHLWHVDRLSRRPHAAERAGGERAHRSALHRPRRTDPAWIDPPGDRRDGSSPQFSLMIAKTEPSLCAAAQ
jgi:hypothetical protein